MASPVSSVDNEDFEGTRAGIILSEPGNPAYRPGGHHGSNPGLCMPCRTDHDREMLTKINRRPSGFVNASSSLTQCFVFNQTFDFNQ